MEQDACRHLLNNLSDYLDGEASARLCAEIERHLAGCADCRLMVDTLRKTIAVYHDLPQPELPAEARVRLYAALHLSEFMPPKS